MLRKEDYAVIKALKKRGVYHSDIAAELGVHPKTVGRALKRDGPPEGTRRRRGSKLDPYKAQVDQLLADGVWNAVVILREIQAAGYDGGSTILREYIGPKRALRAGRATVRFETEPGRQMQSDWGEIITELGGKRVKVSFIVNQLSYSHRFHFWCTDSQDAEHTYQGLINSFETFGGVPREVLVDNQKAAVIEHRSGQPARFNERFLDLADHYGFTPSGLPTLPGARTKGKDERMVGYIKHHFFVRYRSFDSWAHLNQLAESWLRDEADRRVQQTVKEVVAERFLREQPTLEPLPARPYDVAYRQTRQVGWDGYIDVRGNRYSVPGHLTGRTVAVRIGLDDSLRVYDGETLVASHRLRSIQDGWVSITEHHSQLWRDVLSRDALQVDHRPLAVYEEVASWS